MFSSLITVLFLACCIPVEMSLRRGVYIISVLILALYPPSAAALPRLGQTSDTSHMIMSLYYGIDTITASSFAACSVLSNVFFLIQGYCIVTLRRQRVESMAMLPPFETT